MRKTFRVKGVVNAIDEHSVDYFIRHYSFRIGEQGEIDMYCELVNMETHSIVIVVKVLSISKAGFFRIVEEFKTDLLSVLQARVLKDSSLISRDGVTSIHCTVSFYPEVYGHGYKVRIDKSNEGEYKDTNSETRYLI